MGATTVDIPQKFSTVKTFYCALLQTAAATVQHTFLHLPKARLIQPGTALRLLTASDKLDFSEHGDQYCCDCTELISLHHLSRD